MRSTVLLCVVLAALILAGSLAQASLERSPLGSGGEREQDAVVSQVDYLEFLGGVRQFVAYSLWARIDGIHHGYYGNLTAEAELVPYYFIISWLDPHYVDSYYVSSLVIYLAGQEQEAIEFIQQGIAANPDSGDLYASLGDLYLRQKQYELSRQAFQEALGRQFELVDESLVMNSIAAASLAMGDMAGAVSAKLRLLDYYRLALLRSDLDQPTREYLVMRINQLADEVRAIEDGTAGSVDGSTADLVNFVN